jgi:hypothetical protein
MKALSASRTVLAKIPIFNERDIRKCLTGDSGHRAMIPLL